MPSKQVAVVDGANVAYVERTRDGKPKVANLVAVRRVLEEQGFEVIVIVDASLRHAIDAPEQLEAMIENQSIRQAPAGTDADYFVVKTAEEHHGQIISNDEYKQFQEEYAWIKRQRTPLMIINGIVELYQPSE